MKILNKYIIAFIIAIICLVSSNLDWGKKNWRGIIQSDGKGYYSYLPAIFIYHDLNFSFFDEVEKNCYDANTYYDYRASYNGKTIDKYYVGTAVAMFPFFLIAHGLTKLSGLPGNGYSYYYHVFANIAAVFWLMVGLIFLRKLLKRYSATDGQIALILVAFSFGTNIFYYTVTEPSMSHVYSFAFVAMFIYYIKKFFDTGDNKSVLAAAASLGMILLTRPVNGLIIGIIPLLASSSINLKEQVFALFKKPAIIATAILISAGIFFIQFIIYKIQTGVFFFNSYGEEGFNWSDPHFLDILFSYKKGLFIYTPLTFLSLTGFLFLWKKSRFQLFSALLFLIATTYVLSSWWCWFYGGSFGLRAFIEFFPIFALLMFFALEGLKKKVWKQSFLATIILLVLICQFQTYQYRYYYIHWSMMNKERYWNVFLRADQIIEKKNPNADLLNQPPAQ